MRNFSSLALGPPPIGAEGASIVAGVNGGRVPNDVIYYGQWSGGNLVFDAASVPSSGILPSRTSVASCPADPHQMYAATADYNNGFFLGAVWRSVDGGQSWSAVAMPASAGIRASTTTS